MKVKEEVVFLKKYNLCDFPNKFLTGLGVQLIYVSVAPVSLPVMKCDALLLFTGGLESSMLADRIYSFENSSQNGSVLPKTKTNGKPIICLYP